MRMSENVKVVALGGGTGLSAMLRGLRKYTQDLTAVVTVADDGGSSGMLREELNMLPPGDIRNCINALANIDPVMRELINYRFTEGRLAGHSFGNLFLAALNGISESFDEAVRKMNKLLSIDGVVLPVTNENVRLSALLEDGTVVEGESNIGHNVPAHTRIRRVRLIPEKIKPVEGLLERIQEADMITMGPGSLYTSVIPNLLVEGVVDAIRKSRAVKVYVCNLMTQPSETDFYTVYDHISAIEAHSYTGICDYAVCNNKKIPEGILKRYCAEHSEMVKIDRERFKNSRTGIIEDNLLKIEDVYVRHDFDRAAELMMRLCKRL